MPTTSIYLATPCYGGVAQARYMRSLLAFRTACAARGIALQLDLGGGEALISRGRAGMTARFLATAATHLLFVDAESAFSAQEVFGLVESGEAVAASGSCAAGQPSLLLIHRDAAQKMQDDPASTQAKLGDVRNAGAELAAMTFESILEPRTGAYVVDLQAFCRRWEASGGRVWTAASLT